MTVFDRTTHSTEYEMKEHTLPHTTTNDPHDLPSKAQWVIRNSTYHEPDRTHYEE